MSEHSIPTQCERVKQYLLTYGEITQMDALYDLGIMRLASRVSEMRKSGEMITKITRTVKNRYGEQVRIAAYRLEEQK